MPDIIQLLPDSIANQIAAGEVVQRPASAVKELMENSLDAGATRIRLIVREAGKSLIQVVDDGSGMSATDARMSLERHATSKIRTADDLFRIRTMGFRGEALASIAAVSQMEMKTRQAHEELGTLILVEGSEVKKQESVACEKGTSISVKNLFYNIPARRNFLKSVPVEMRHVTDEFQRLALANAEVAFSLWNGEELMYDLPAAKLQQRIVGLFGKAYQQQLAHCEAEVTMVKVQGFVGRPESARKTRGEQFLFVNNRFIRNNYLHHAVMNAFEGLLPDNSFPFYVLFIEIDPKHVDVNVHPTKTEVKFDDERAVYAVVRAAVKQGLGTHNLVPALDFSADVNLVQKLQSGGSAGRDVFYEEQWGSLQQRNLKNWEQLYEREGGDSRLAFPEQKPEMSPPRAEAPMGGQGTADSTPAFQFQQKYIVWPVAEGLMLIDQEAAHERILYEKFQQHLRNRSGASQQSLFPQSVVLAPADFALIMEIMPELTALGFRLEEFGKNTVLVTGIPVDGTAHEKHLLDGLLEQFKSNQSTLQLPVGDNLARSLARRTGIRPGQKLGATEINSLVTRLFQCAVPSLAADGRPTFFIVDTSKIERYFGR